ncbi:MAG: AgmX/PglI C-terminal domain-containing protein [Byssovorax sp.]
MIRRLGAWGLAASVLTACSGAPPLTPPPPTTPPPLLTAAVPVPVPVPLPAPAPTPPDQPAKAPDPPPAPKPPPVTIEIPFQLDKRPTFTTKEAFLLDLRERTRWNKGSLGTLAAEVPKTPGHPMPKVIVDVKNSSGGHKAADVQRVLRKMLWIKVIECYGLGAYKDQKLHGTVAIGFKISSAGQITGARAAGGTLPDDDVVACLVNRVQRVEMPRAKKGSRASILIEINHGDEPMPPPPSLITPGDGVFDREAVRAVITAALPDLEACYRPALAYAPELWGRLGIRFHLTEKGKLDEAFEVESQFPDENVSLCALRAARKLKFPKAEGGEIRFVVPLRFGVEPAPASEPAAPSPGG